MSTMRHRVELTLGDLTDLHPKIPDFARIVDVETVGTKAVIITTEWEDQ